MLQPNGLLVDHMPWHAHNINQEPLQNTMPLHHCFGQHPAIISQADLTPSITLYISTLFQATNDDRHCWRGHMHPLSQACTDHWLLAGRQVVDNLEIFAHFFCRPRHRMSAASVWMPICFSHDTVLAIPSRAHSDMVPGDHLDIPGPAIWPRCERLYMHAPL